LQTPGILGNNGGLGDNVALPSGRQNPKPDTSLPEGRVIEIYDSSESGKSSGQASSDDACSDPFNDPDQIPSDMPEVIIANEPILSDHCPSFQKRPSGAKVVENQSISPAGETFNFTPPGHDYSKRRPQ